MTENTKLDNSDTSVVKKGNKPTWKPAMVLDKVDGVPEGHTARYVRNEEKNVQRKLKEGWIPLNKTNSGAKAESEEHHIKDSHTLGSHIGKRELVVMVLPDELKQAREEHFQKETRTMTEAKLKAHDQRKKPGGEMITAATVIVS